MTQQKGTGRGARSTPRSSPGTPEKRLSFTRPQMTRDQILVEGERAAELLNAPIFNLAVNSVVEDLGQEILRTQPHESQRREWLYSQGAALGRSMYKLAEFVQMAQALNMEELQQEELAQQNYGEDAGFGPGPQ